MTDELPRATDPAHLIDDLTRSVPGPLVPAVRPEGVPDESERILAERDARKGLHPPEVSLRRIG